MATLRPTRTRTRNRRRRDEPLARVTVLRGSLVLASFAGLVYLALSVYNGVPTANYATYKVSVPTIGNLLEHDAVRIAGKRVGQVSAIDLGADGRPLVKLQLDPGTKLPRDTRVVIRANGLLGARYVELTPGHDRALLAHGATIRGGTRSFTNGLPEVLDTFDGATRRSLRRDVDALSTGLVGLGAPLNGAVRDLGIGPRRLDEVARAVLARDGAAARLIPSLDAAIGALEPARGYIRPGLTSLSTAVRPLITERAATRATLRAAPAALDAITPGLTRGRRLLASVRDLAGAAATTLPQAPAAFRDLSVLLGAARRPLRRLVPDLKHRLPVAATGVRDLLGDVDAKLVPELKQTVDRLRPQLRYIGSHGCDFANFGAVMRSMTGFGQAGSGPNGPAMAFRLEIALPAGGELAGVDANGPLGAGLFKRVGYEAPCTYLSKPYPQLTQDPLGILTPTQGRSAR
jgi:phospholipid/cholesterol/gamma-HCH transport system substrate-binding protein